MPPATLLGGMSWVTTVLAPMLIDGEQGYSSFLMAYNILLIRE